MSLYQELIKELLHMSLVQAGQSWLYGSWIYNYLCNQCLSPLTLWVRILLRRGVLYTTLCHKVCQWLATGQWLSPGATLSSTNKTDYHDITDILLKVALNTITPSFTWIMRYITKLWFRLGRVDKWNALLGYVPLPGKVVLINEIYYWFMSLY